jgi:tRNA synthetases class I (R)/Arginyl tRNA synthetase N terminal domain
VGDIQRSDHADYQSDLTLRLARQLRRDPRDIAAAMLEHLRPHAVLDTASVSGPGFINLTLRTASLSDAAGHMLADKRIGVGRPKHPDTVVVDYSLPNLAKEMHVGHLRRNLIGEALACLLAFLGHCVVRHNRVGDGERRLALLIEHQFDESLAGRASSVRGCPSSIGLPASSSTAIFCLARPSAGRASYARRKPARNGRVPPWRISPDECFGKAYRTRRGFIYRSASCFSILGS